MATNVDLSRRALLRGRLRQPDAGPVRPPWAIDERNFLDRCTRCGDCAVACPETILRQGDGDFPVVDFTAGACTFCGACVDGCATGALSKNIDPPWRYVAKVSDECLPRRGISCQSCRDACQVGAISFSYRPGEPIPAPQIDAASCTGCGECVSRCPGNALSVGMPEQR